MLASLPAHWAAGPLGYVAGMVVLAKLARGVELSLRLHSARPWLILPATLGQDALLVGTVGLIAFGLGKLRHAGVRLALTLLLLVPVGLLLPADLISQLLTGRPITIQRLRGDEGATLKDINLLATSDLLGGIAGIALAFALLWIALRFGPRSALLRRWARPKAMLVTLLLGFCVALAQGALLPRTHGLDEQPVFVLLGSFVGHELGAVALSDSEWHALLAPSEALPAPPEVPAMPAQRPKNVVIFAAEGVPFKDTGFDPGFNRPRPGDERNGAIWPNPTPNLTRRAAQHGLVFDRYYANWHASIQAIFSIACSSFPPMSGDIVRIKPRIDCGELSESLKRGGVTPGLFHSGQFSFYNKLALLGRRGYAIELDSEELAKTSKRSRQQWGIDDRAMTDATLQWVDSLPKGKPFAALLIAITAHYPYWVPRDFKRPFAGSTRHERFLNAVAFQDQVFEELVRGFERRGLYEDTLFVWLGDHGHYVAEPERETPGLRGFYEPNLHTPLLLLNPRMFPETLAQSARVNSRLGSHVDLQPTVLDVLGVAADPRHSGQSLLSPSFEQRRMYFGADDGHYAGFIEGWHKYALELRNGRSEYYDLRKDPDELHDLSATQDARMKSYREDALRFARGVQARIEQAPVLDEEVSVAKIYDMFMANVSVASGERGQLLPCTRGPDASCPGIGTA
ncbi:MAG TPA: LTA synthase family protein, partial [Polyangiales bacterium]|nr:LTA synthase family protein [Polyangiales bacterium]